MPNATFFVLFTAIIVLPVVVGLTCHHCSDQSLESNCRLNMKHLKKAAQGKDEFWTKNCTAAHPNYTMCYIEEIRSQGDVKSFIRDCSDGNTFSFAKTGLLLFLRPNNQSVCQYDRQGYQICITLCNQEDFCNGPASANVNRISVLTVLFPTSILLLIATWNSS